METFHLLHLAGSCRPRAYTLSSTAREPVSSNGTSSVSEPIPPTDLPAPSIVLSSQSTTSSSSAVLTNQAQPAPLSIPPFSSARPQPRGRIYAAAAQMVFASRNANNTFITPEEVARVQEWGGRGCLDALARAGTVSEAD